VRGTRARARARGEPAPLATLRLATRHRRRYGGYLVHAGILVMAVAVAISSTTAQGVERTLRPGQMLSIAGYTLTYRGLDSGPLASDPRVAETRAHLDFSGPQEGSLVASVRDYPSSSTPILTPAVRGAFGEDLYVTLLGYDAASGAAQLAVFVNPLVGWIWIGGAIVVAGGLFAAWPERRPLLARARDRRRLTTQADAPAAPDGTVRTGDAEPPVATPVGAEGAR
jgi:cytochrome c-type biogenesis protein CcmF